MNINSAYNPENNEVTLNITLGLLENYYNNFVGYFKKDPKSPKNLTINRKGENTAELIFTATDDLIKSTERLNNQNVKVTLDLTDVNRILGDFINSALKYKNRHTEFLPLEGYPLEELKEDVKKAIINKRNFCIIGTYKEYTDKIDDCDPSNPDTYKYHQYYVNYGTSEYADVAILIETDRLSELAKIVKPKLVLTEWV